MLPARRAEAEAKRLAPGPMADSRTPEAALIFALAAVVSLVAWELDHEVLSTVFAIAAGVAFVLAPE
jgi:hypothetical protein